MDFIFETTKLLPHISFIGLGLATLIGAGLGLAGSIFSGSKRAQGAEAQVAATREINQKRLNFQREMWRKTNKYNLPLHQRARLEAAGLNPNLLYGSGASGGNAGMLSAPNLDVPDVAAKYNAFAGVPKQFMALYQQAIQTQMLKSKRQNIDADTGLKKLESAIKGIEVLSDKLSYKKEKELYDTAVETVESQLKGVKIKNKNMRMKNLREERIVESTVNKLNQEILNLKSKGKILSEKAIIQRIERKLIEDTGLNLSDPYLFRIGIEIYRRLQNVSERQGGFLPEFFN